MELLVRVNGIQPAFGLDRCSQAWATLIKRVYEVDPLACPRCGGRMKVIAFISYHSLDHAQGLRHGHAEGLAGRGWPCFFCLFCLVSRSSRCAASVPCSDLTTSYLAFLRHGTLIEEKFGDSSLFQRPASPLPKGEGTDHWQFQGTLRDSVRIISALSGTSSPC